MTPRALTVTADDASKVYGEVHSLNGGAFTSAGLQNGETIGSVSLASGGAAAGAGVNGGTAYAITASGAAGGSFDAGNYTIRYVDGGLTVTPRALTVTADDASKVYGEAHSLNGGAFTSAGLQNGETIGSVSLASGGAAAGAGVNGGTAYAITASGAAGGSFDAGNYTIRYVDGRLTVTPRELTVTANAVSKVYGDADHLSYTLAGLGLINGDALAGSLERNTGENVGSYAIQQGTLANANYTIRFTGNSLSITPRALTLVAATDHKTYDGSTTSNAAVRIEGLVDGDRITGLGQSFDSRNAGRRGLQVNSGYAIEDGNGGGNYEVTTRGAEGRIDPRALTIAADNAHKLSGQLLGFDGTEFSTNDGGLVAGETVQSVTLASAGSAAQAGAGSYAIAASNVQGGNGFDAGNYDIRYVDGSLSVTLPVPQPVEPPVAPSVKPPVHPSVKSPFTSFATRSSLISLAGDAECIGQTVRQAAGEPGECSLTAGYVPMLQVAPEFVGLR